MKSERSEFKGWWTISAERFMQALERAHAGEEPEALYIEHYANCTIEDARGE